MKREIQYSRRKTGIAEIRELRKTVKIIQASGKILEIPHENVTCPVTSGEDMYYVLNQDETFLYELRPSAGKFYARFAGIPHREGELPKPFTIHPRDMYDQKTGRAWRTRKREVFNTLFEIQAGKFEGLLLKGTFDYCFVQGNSGYATLKGFGRNALRTESMLRVCGFDFQEDDIVFDEEFLKNLSVLLIERGELVEVMCENKGYIKRLESVPEGFEL